MTYILDTHALVWWLYEPEHLSSRVVELVSDSQQQILVSAASAYEVTNKYRLGKWDAMAPLANAFEKIVSDQAMDLLSITVGDAAEAGMLQSDHRDPFDRLIAAQSVRGPYTVLTKDAKLAELGAITLW